MHDFRLGIRDYRIRTLLKCPVAGLIEDTIFEDEVLAIAERLGAGDAATDETEIAGVPTEVLTFDLGVVDGNVFALPERIFSVENSVVNLDMLRVLENIFALQLDIGDLKLEGMHKGV